MKSISYLSSLVLAGILVVGCGPQAAKTEEPKTGEGSVSKNAPEPEKPKEVESKLKHNAFKLMGFEKMEPYTYALTKMEGVDPQEGNQNLELLESTPTAAKYQVTRDGGMEALGSEDFEVREDGVYNTRMSFGDLDKPTMVMPASVAVGSTWENSFTTTDSSGRKVTYKATNKAERNESVTVKAGKYDALLVTTTGTMDVTEGGKTMKSELSSKTWYSEGVGQVKMTLEIKKSDKTNVKSSVELTKIGTKAP